LENVCVRRFAASPQLYLIGPNWFNYRLVYGYLIFFIIPVYLQSVQVNSVNWLKEVDECVGEGRSLALLYN
jgi:hypothetical protein